MFKSTLRNNILANFGGKAWSGIIQLVFIPLYIKFLGVEAFGLIGFFVMLQNLLLILDFGLSITLNRGLASGTDNANPQEAHDLVRTMEWIYWSIALVIAVGISFAAPWIAHSWVKVKGLTIHTIQIAIMLMGLVAAAQWPHSLYSGGLMGLQKQVLLNAVRSIMATIQAVGAVIVLCFISRSVEAYFIWQIVLVAIQTTLLGYFLRASLPKTSAEAHFRWDSLRKFWHFAAGMTGISTATMILAQADKLILSKLISLDQFGYYTLAFTIGNALMLLVMPISNALFPKFSELFAAGKSEELCHTYHKGCQTASFIIFPIGILMALFPKEILMLWTHNAIVAENTHVILSLVAVGCVLNAAITTPLIFQLAHGWTSLSFYTNWVAIMILIPLLLIIVPNLGAVGGAVAWITLNIGYVVFQIPLMHRRLIPKEMWHWYGVDIGLPALCCLVIGFAERAIMPENISTSMQFILFVIVLGSMMAACLIVMPFSRNYCKEAIIVLARKKLL